MPDGELTRVLICDDQELMRVGLRMVVDSQPDLEVVGEAADGPTAVAAAATLRPDVVLLDIRMPGLDGVAATAQIRAAAPAARVVVITTFDLDEYAFAALRAGASGFVVKDAPSAELLVAVRGVLRGDPMVSPSVTRRLLERYVTGGAEQPTADPRAQLLTDREREVLGLLAQGLSNAEIAARLFLGETTVKTHVSRILTKLRLRDRIGAVVFAYESGLARPGH
jgi:DNA-binding NarL/FixJ family response regulator